MFWLKTDLLPALVFVGQMLIGLQRGRGRNLEQDLIGLLYNF